MLDDMMRVTHQSRNVDFFSFTVFLAVAARRSFRGAATELEITPSAVSHSVKALERRLGVRLLNRTTRSTSLTEAGERLAAKLRPDLSVILWAGHIMRCKSHGYADEEEKTNRSA
ncbi:LysR family transcriptional regulator, partial [Burkholderia cenocepacia]|uniref:LysR family transcriptional regulator n=1 Tax=Burkholderia cenocepacia TaxID=95486 RepID=UPI001FC86AD6